MYDKIKERYKKYYVTENQLDRYVTLGVITQAQAKEIRESRIETPSAQYQVMQSEVDTVYREGVNDYE